MLQIKFLRVKRFLATILAVIYFTASTGAAVHIHYCMGKLQSVNLWHSQEKKKLCSTCGMTNKKGCCEDKHEVLKLEKKYNIPVTGISATKIHSLPVQYYAIDPALFQRNISLNYSFSNSPPGRGNSPLFIRNCVFRIWGIFSLFQAVSHARNVYHIGTVET